MTTCKYKDFTELDRSGVRGTFIAVILGMVQFVELIDRRVYAGVTTARGEDYENGIRIVDLQILRKFTS